MEQEQMLRLLSRLTGALVGLANAADSHSHAADALTAAIVREALLANMDGDHQAPTGNISIGHSGTVQRQTEQYLQELIGKVHTEKARIAPDCAACKSPCGRTLDFDMRLLRYDDEDVRRMKEEILSALKALAAQGKTQDEAAFETMLEALRAIGDTWDAASLLPLAQKISQL